MDWWTGMNFCGSGSTGDMNQIEAGIFDPWINCDDLDLSTILNQANHSSTISTTTTTTTSSSSPISAQALLSNHPTSSLIGQQHANNAPNQQQQQQQFSSSINTDSPTSDSGILSGSCHSNNGHLQNYAGFVCQNSSFPNSTNAFQQQHQLAPTTPTTVSGNSKQNIFNIISSAAVANATISSHNNNQHHQQNNNSHTPQTSVSSQSQCSSTSSMASSISSLESSPINNQSNYLSSPSCSSPILIAPSTASLLMVDRDHNNLTSNSQHKNILLQQNLHQRGFNQLNCCDQQQQHLQHQTSSHFQNRVAFTDPDQQCGDRVDSKSNLENLLHRANGGNSANNNFNSLTKSCNNGRDHFSLNLNGTDQLVVACSQSSTSSSSNNNSLSLSANNSLAAVISSASNATTNLNQQHSAKTNKSYSNNGSSNHNNNNNKNNSSLTNNQSNTQKVRRCRHITDYVLADEEKRLLIKEGYTDFPMICQARPLSKTEERILRKIRRKIRNKKSAQCSRQRKKEYVEDLERKYAAVIRENDELKQVLERLQPQRQLQQTGSGSPNLDWRDLIVDTVKSSQIGDMYN